MQSSFLRRTLPKSIIALAITVLGVLLSSGASPVSAAAPFSASTSVTLGAGANPDITLDLLIPAPDYNFSAVVNAVPSAGFVAPGPGNPGFVGGTHPALGDVVGTLTSTPTLGLLNGACSGSVPGGVNFVFLNATVDITDTISPVPAASVNTGDGNVLASQWSDDGASAAGTGADPPWNAAGGRTDATAATVAIGLAPQILVPELTNGLPAQVDDYPEYLNTLFTPDGGSPVAPWARYAGAEIPGDSVTALNLVVFAPDVLANAFAAPHPFNDLEGMGYTSIAVLNDTTKVSGPSSIGDFCTLLSTQTVLYGTAKTNPCRAAAGPTACDSPREISNPVAGAATKVRWANPATAGTYLFPSFQQSLRDSDGDGKENNLDTCPLNAETYNPRAAAGPASGGHSDNILDPDDDAIPQAAVGGCDTVVPPAQIDIQDQDEDKFQNTNDNCPTVINGVPTLENNLESEVNLPYLTAAPRGGPRTDSIGDACDPDDTKASGMFFTTITLVAKCIGGVDADGDGWCATGGGQPNDPLDTIAGGGASRQPESYSLQYQVGIAHSGSGATPPMSGNSAAGVESRNPAQVCSDGIDNDGDTLVDNLDLLAETPANTSCRPPNPVLPAHPGFPLCPAAGCPGIDSDGDGFTDREEMLIGTDALGRCQAGGGGVFPNPPWTSSDWPADFDSTTVPNSVDKVTLIDLTSFLGPTYKLNTSPGNTTADATPTTEYLSRWDLVPGPTVGPNWIQLNDLTSLLGGATGFPPMFAGLKAFGGAFCTTVLPGPYGD